jgi:hypothetical protein
MAIKPSECKSAKIEMTDSLTAGAWEALIDYSLRAGAQYVRVDDAQKRLFEAHLKAKYAPFWQVTVFPLNGAHLIGFIPLPQPEPETEEDGEGEGEAETAGVKPPVHHTPNLMRTTEARSATVSTAPTRKRGSR